VVLNLKKLNKKIRNSLLGNIPWNKDLTKETNESVARTGQKNKETLTGRKQPQEVIDKIKEGLIKAYADGTRIPWNEGLTKETDERIKKSGRSVSESFYKKKLVYESQFIGVTTV
jgi:hypothetical protein